LGRRLDLAGAEGLERRALPAGFQTAYPRHSKLFQDPGAGLASVEAMFAVTVILGTARPDFLQHYRWAGEFLELNRELLSRYGWKGS
jgi:pre-rRNA-processing protein TSR3